MPILTILLILFSNGANLGVCGFLRHIHIKSSENQEADYESRRINVETEWEILNKAFQFLSQKFGEPNFDLFATRLNTKCKIFSFWRFDPDAYLIDAFTFKWRDFSFYAFPPFSLIHRVLHKIILDRAEVILVVPLWTGLDSPGILYSDHYNLLLCSILVKICYFPYTKNSTPYTRVFRWWPHTYLEGFTIKRDSR